MGVDYQARKAAKKNRRREEVKPRRERKKKQARRLCRGPCYQEPVLTPDDLDEAGGRAGRPATIGGGELARFAAMDFGGEAAAAAEGSAGGSKQKAGDKRKSGDRSGAGAAAVAAPAAKKPKLSTAVNLLDAKTARKEAPRQKQLPAAAVSEELLAFPDLVQRFMAGEGFPEPMPIQSK